MTKKEIKNEILDKVSKMELNSYLFPVGHTQTINMTNYEWSYRTYNNGSTGERRYHIIEIVKEQKTTLKLIIHGDTITYEQPIGEKILRPKDILFYVNEIYEEKHSFRDDNGGVKKLRKELNSLFKQKRSVDKDIELKRKQIEDCIELENNKT